MLAVVERQPREARRLRVPLRYEQPADREAGEDVLDEAQEEVFDKPRLAVVELELLRPSLEMWGRERLARQRPRGSPRQARVRPNP